MKKYFVLILLAMGMKAYAQKTGIVSYTINITSMSGGTVTQNVPQPYYKYTNYDAYWFTKPNGERYVMINGGKDLGIVILHNNENDVDVAYQDKYQGDQLDLEGMLNGKKFICTPDNDKGPVHIHYSVFNAGELEFTFTGPVAFALSTNNKIKGTINGTIHLYRDAMYEKSAMAPNCNCDPTIYATFYDPEIGRTPSPCENAVLWRVYNAFSPALNPLVGLAYTGSGGAPVGSLIYRQDHSMMDVTPAPEVVNACSPDNARRGVVPVDAQNHLFSQDNYALGFIKLVNTDQFSPKNPAELQANMTKLVKLSDSLYKLVIAKKMSSEEANRQVNAGTKAINDSQKGVPDIHQAEVYAHLDVSAAVNINQWYVSDLANAEIQHNVPGAAFEIYRPSLQINDGHWMPFLRVIFYGKFNIIKAGNRITKITAVVDPNVSKLAIFNAMIKISGGQDLVDQAMSTIQFSAIPPMFNNN